MAPALILLLGCVVAPDEEPPEPPLVAADLWDGVPGSGAVITLVDARVASPRSVSDDHFFVQDRAGGPRSGVRVELGGILEDWPPAVGTPVELTGPYLLRGDGPTITLRADDDGVVLGDPEPVVAAPWADDPELVYGVVTAPDLTVTSAVDPTGHADTDGGVGVGGLFGVSPGFGRTGDLTGILLDDRVSARDASDWTGELQGDPPVPVTVEELPSLPDGTPVVLDDLLLATPWSRDGRYALLQDPSGAGAWMDAEAWGLSVRVAEGSVGTWTGEARSDGEGPHLRAWEPPVEAGTGAPRIGAEVVDGALVRVEVDGLGQPGLFGERSTAQGWLLDDRFLDLDDLPDPALVTGAVRVLPDGETRIAVVDSEPAP